ncbi:regulator of cell morphogenesis and NO signaling [Andreprevotia lacus DSM 23236]|jgi:regulator of cell morphogenesis and NO signaling|uniref:Regulator of cell morphogenesis and NO signaling n=1 Tax=Andreprevotia lacus DSM 23236 TaxID=1121001 RepID=A0A1W1XXX9_9NEIS|nr:iron-sulfur cluster repair protein YtfE [Andreprevotia lacus]SMC28401.1 regulator of cell morphogenesis and NO signaling [Andreprevotia lacus DSM 23236]
MNTRQDTVSPVQADAALGQIAVALPGATAVFRRLKLDYCCGGQISLRQAAANKGLNLDDLVAELAALQRSDAQPAAQDAGTLIDHILTRYHEVHRVQLPELVAMARRVEAVHRDHPAVPAGLAALLAHMEEELLSHMAKEEQVLFPMLKAGGNPFVVHPIGMMRAEHVDHGLALDRLAELTRDLTPPEDACTTWRALYAGINQLRDDLINHIHLENNVLFPMFDTAATTCGPTACACGG